MERRLRGVVNGQPFFYKQNTQGVPMNLKQKFLSLLRGLLLPERYVNYTTRWKTKTSESTSKYLGVSLVKRSSAKIKRWQVTISFCGKNYYLGRYTNEEEAAKTYDKVARYLYGKIAKTNFEGIEAISPEELISTYKKNIKHGCPRSSKYLGVVFRKRTKTYEAYIYHNNKRAFIGSFKEEEEAALAYNIFAEKYGKPTNQITTKQ